MSERWTLILLVGAFLLAFFLPIETPRAQGALRQRFFRHKDYAREHVLLCLVPAFFIAGAIGQFVSQAAVLRYLGAKAPRPVAYGVASVSGSVLAVCSCTVLPLFASIYRRGAGLGPATAFLYSGPAINVLALILTARVLGLEIGLARAVGAVVFAVVVGLLMAFLFRREEAERQDPGVDPFAAAAVEKAPRQGRHQGHRALPDRLPGRRRPRRRRQRRGARLAAHAVHDLGPARQPLPGPDRGHRKRPRLRLPALRPGARRRGPDLRQPGLRRPGPGLHRRLAGGGDGLAIR